MTSLPSRTIHVLYENPDWLPPLIAGLEAEGFCVKLCFVDEGLVGQEAPPEGLWLNRVSPSSHTRGHERSVALTRSILFWLESHGRRVLNGLHAFELEMSKLRQDIILRRHGISTPKSVLTVGVKSLLEAAKGFDGPFLTKHDQGGKGRGIQLFEDADALARHVAEEGLDAGPAEKVLLQQYVEPAAGFITRVEIVGGRFLFAMRSETDQGFELCPSDVCQIERAKEAAGRAACPIDGGGSLFAPSPLTAEDPLVQSYVSLCEAEGIDVAGIEFVEDADGKRYTYDINGTTNYNQGLGRQIGIDGMRELARHARSVAAKSPELARVVG